MKWVQNWWTYKENDRNLKWNCRIYLYAIEAYFEQKYIDWYAINLPSLIHCLRIAVKAAIIFPCPFNIRQNQNIDAYKIDALGSVSNCFESQAKLRQRWQSKWGKGHRPKGHRRKCHRQKGHRRKSHNAKLQEIHVILTMSVVERFALKFQRTFSSNPLRWVQRTPGTGISAQTSDLRNMRTAQSNNVVCNKLKA